MLNSERKSARFPSPESQARGIDGPLQTAALGRTGRPAPHTQQMAHLMSSSSMGTPSALSYRAAIPDIRADAGNEGSADMLSPEAELRALRAKRRMNEEAARAARKATARIGRDRDSVAKAAAFPESLEPIEAPDRARGNGGSGGSGRSSCDSSEGGGSGGGG